MRLLLILTFLTTTCTQVYGTELYGGVIGTKEFVRIDRTNAASETIGVLSQDIRGLAFDYDSNTLYGLGLYHLLEIDPTDGSSSMIGTLPNYISATALAFDPLDKLLYVADEYLDALFIFDPSTGITSNGPQVSGFSEIEGLSFNPNTGVLYGLATRGIGQIIEIDKVSGNATALPITISSNNPRSLAFDPSANALFIGTSFSGASLLHRYDLTTNTLDLIGSIGPTQALAIIVPEPTSQALVCCGLFMAATVCLRHRRPK